MKRKARRPAPIKLEAAKPRYQPDPHRRDRVIENKKRYDRKALSKAEPSDFLVALVA